MPARPGAHHAPDFEALFAQSDDPWQFRTRWYEERKRALTLAALPHPRYANAYEPGCANGELSAALALRCDRLLVSDGAAGAVRAARERLAAWPHVDVQQAVLPEGWPDETFDLIVLSELGYYFDATDLEHLIKRTRASLRAGGIVLACHWLPSISGCRFNGHDVHQRLSDGLALSPVLQMVDADFRLDVWSDDARSVAQRECIR